MNNELTRKQVEQALFSLKLEGREQIPSLHALLNHDAAIRARGAALTQLEQFIGLKFDEPTQTYVSGHVPYLSAGRTKLEACIAAIDALRLVAATYETKYSALRAQLTQVTKEE